MKIMSEFDGKTPKIETLYSDNRFEDIGSPKDTMRTKNLLCGPGKTPIFPDKDVSLQIISTPKILLCSPGNPGPIFPDEDVSTQNTGLPKMISCSPKAPAPIYPDKYATDQNARLPKRLLCAPTPPIFPDNDVSLRDIGLREEDLEKFIDDVNKIKSEINALKRRKI